MAYKRLFILLAALSQTGCFMCDKWASIGSLQFGDPFLWVFTKIFQNNSSECEDDGGSFAACTTSDGIPIIGSGQAALCCLDGAAILDETGKPPRGCPGGSQGLLDAAQSAISSTQRASEGLDIAASLSGGKGAIDANGGPVSTAATARNERLDFRGKATSAKNDPLLNESERALKDLRKSLSSQTRSALTSPSSLGSSMFTQVTNTPPNDKELSSKLTTQNAKSLPGSLYSGKGSAVTKGFSTLQDQNAGIDFSDPASIGFTDRALASSQILDPEDYFSKIDIYSNLFDIVGARYKRKSLQIFAPK